MKLHTFNPGHDIALASNRMAMPMPHAARELADEGEDVVLYTDEDDDEIEELEDYEIEDIDE